MLNWRTHAFHYVHELIDYIFFNTYEKCLSQIEQLDEAIDNLILQFTWHLGILLHKLYYILRFNKM